MGIDWYRVKFLAVDGSRSIWTYATDNVGRDLRCLAEQLPKHPESELVAAERGIAIIFHGSYAKIARAIERICDKITDEGMERATTGKTNDEHKSRNESVDQQPNRRDGD